MSWRALLLLFSVLTLAGAHPSALVAQQPTIRGPQQWPPPPPAPDPGLVFFNFDSATISPEGLAIVAQEASSINQHPGTRVQVTGYSDGPEPYASKLAEERAQNVTAALVRFGVPSDSIDTSGRAVPSSAIARVRENNRVEIFW